MMKMPTIDALSWSVADVRRVAFAYLAAWKRVRVALTTCRGLGWVYTTIAIARIITLVDEGGRPFTDGAAEFFADRAARAVDECCHCTSCMKART